MDVGCYSRWSLAQLPFPLSPMQVVFSGAASVRDSANWWRSVDVTALDQTFGPNWQTEGDVHDVFLCIYCAVTVLFGLRCVRCIRCIRCGVLSHPVATHQPLPVYNEASLVSTTTQWKGQSYIYAWFVSWTSSLFLYKPVRRANISLRTW